MEQKNIDTGMGLERILTIFNGKTNVYETELFVPLMTKLEEILESLGKIIPEREKRIICEHIRATTFILEQLEKEYKLFSRTLDEGLKKANRYLNQVAAIVNEAIEKQIEVIMEELPLKEAYESGAIGVFSGKYEDVAKVYTIPGYSKEICGGPHAKNTGELVSFKILKEEASSAGVRRIKAVIEAH